MLSMKPKAPKVSADPVPSLTERFRAQGALRRTDVNALADEAIASMRGSIQSVVTGLQEDERPFRVVFGKTGTAATNLRARLVYMGTKAMDDLTITDGQLAAIMVGLANHEVAHINYDREYVEFVKAQLAAHPLVGMVQDIHNIGQDIRIEARSAKDLPGYADTLPVVVWYMTEYTGAKAPFAKTSAVSQSVARNMFFAAVRAPWIVRDWTGSEDARIWGADWAVRFAATDKRQTIADLIKEALDKMLTWMAGYVKPAAGEKPEPPMGDDEPPVTDGGDFTEDKPEPEPKDGKDPDDMAPPAGDPDEDDEPEPTEPGGEDDEPEDGDEPDVTTGSGKDEPEDDEPEGDPTDDEGKGEDRSNEWSDEDGEDAASELHETYDAPAGAEPTETRDIEDLEFPTCASDALKGENDNTYEATARRVEKSREESNTRIIRTPGWRPRKVVKRWDWNDTPS